MQKMCTKSYLILVNNPKQPLHAINSFKKEIFTDVEEGLYIKKLTLIFLLNPVLFNGQNYQKRGLELVTSCLSGYQTSSKKIPFSYVLSDQVKAVFELSEKLQLQIYASQFMTS